MPTERWLSLRPDKVSDVPRTPLHWTHFTVLLTLSQFTNLYSLLNTHIGLRHHEATRGSHG